MEVCLAGGTLSYRDQGLTLYRNGRAQQVWMNLDYSPVPDETGQPVGVLAVVVETTARVLADRRNAAEGSDVTERVVAERQQKLLTNELSHRVKKMLATVNVIATRTLRGAASLEEAGAGLTARITALSRAQDIVTQQNADGAEIGEVVTAAVRSHDDDRQRFQIDGPGLKLNSGAARTLSLALHELSTNATKYGALSVDSGHVGIDWTVEQRDDGPVLRFTWEESGGPVVSPPTRRGFGSMLIEEAVAEETGGTTRLDYRPPGVVFTLDAPLKAIE